LNAAITAIANAVLKVTHTRADRLATQTNPATTKGSRMWATTAPSLPLACAEVSVARDAHAVAAHARGHRAGATTPLARYAVHADNGIAVISNQPIVAPTDELGASMNGRCSRTQAPADRRAR
jgi:hypothetical protein